MDALTFEEHMLGAAKPNAFGTEGSGGPGIGRRVGIGAHGHAAGAVAPTARRRRDADERGGG